MTAETQTLTMASGVERPWISALLRVLRSLRGLVPLAAVLLAWQLLGSPSSPYFPLPSQWWEALVRDSSSGVLWAALGLTVGDFLLALLLAIVIGAVVGIVTGASQAADAALNPLMRFLRAIPAAAIVPAFTLLIGATNNTTIIVVVFASVWPVIISTRAAMHTLNPLLLDVSHTLHLTRSARVRKLLIPSLYSSIVLAARVTAPIALLITILVQLLTGDTGIGGLLGTAQSQFDSATVFAYVAVSGLLAVLVNAGLHGLGAYANRYAPTTKN